jgi:hypothetical protein
MTEEQIHAWWQSENGLEDCNMSRRADFLLVVRAVEQKLASLAKPQPAEPMADEAAHTELGSRAYKAAFDAGRRDAIKEMREDGEPQPVGVSAFDEAVAAELPLVSSVPYNSREICQWFSERVRARLATLSAPTAQPGEAVSAEPSEYLRGYMEGQRDAAPAQAAAVPDPYREHLAQQAENIEQERLQRCLTLMGSASAGEGQEGFSARLAENVNRLTHAVDQHFSQAAAVPEAVERDAARLDYLQRRGATVEIVSVGGGGWKFRVGGQYSSANSSIREAIDAAIDRLAAPEAGAEPTYTPCGGCGATKPSQRCIGCLHPFEAGASDKGEKS